MISVHYAAPPPAKIWSHAAISFATVYASLVSLVYVTRLFVVEPHLLNRTESQVELLVFKPGSFMQMVDGIGYTFMGVAAVFAAPCFIGSGLARWARFLSIVSGPAALLVFWHVFYSFTLGLPAALLFPGVRRSARPLLPHAHRGCGAGRCAQGMTSGHRLARRLHRGHFRGRRWLLHRCDRPSQRSRRP